MRVTIYNHTLYSLHLASDIEHEEEGEGPLVVPGHLTGVGATAAKLGPKRLRPGNIRLVPRGLWLSVLINPQSDV